MKINTGHTHTQTNYRSRVISRSPCFEETVLLHALVALCLATSQPAYDITHPEYVHTKYFSRVRLCATLHRENNEQKIITAYTYTHTHTHKTPRQIKGILIQESLLWSSVQFSSVAQSCPTLCDPMHCSTPGFPVHHQLPEFTQTYVHSVGDAIQPSHPLSSPSPATFNLS